jgi:hypothetical protein
MLIRSVCAVALRKKNAVKSGGIWRFWYQLKCGGKCDFAIFEFHTTALPILSIYIESNQTPMGAISSPMITVVENQEGGASAEFHREIEARNAQQTGVEHLNLQFPAILMTFYKETVTELSVIQRPVKKSKLIYWVAPYLKSEARETF